MSLRTQRPILDESVDTRLFHERVLYRKERPVLAMNFRSSETTTTGQPVYFNEDVIEGTVQLLGAKSVEKVTFQGKGFVFTPDVGAENVFWSTEEVYTGTQSWNFTVRIPANVAVRTKRGPLAYPLPPSYRQRMGGGMIEYQLAVCAYRGVLRDSYKLSVPFIYVPRCTPAYPLWRTPSSEVEGTAVEESFVDIGPSGPRTVPRGSLTNLAPMDMPCVSRQLSIQGAVFGNRQVLVTVRGLYPNPPIFARDAPIQASLVFESDDAHVLDILTSPGAISARLVQKATFLRGQTHEDILCEGAIRHTRPLAPAPGRQSRPMQRKVEVSLDCPRNICPTFNFPGLTLQHFISVQVTADGFFIPNVKPIPVLRQSIQIVSDSTLP